LTEEASMEDIKQAQEKLFDLGIKLNLNNIKYNEAENRIEKISVTYQINGNSGTASWAKGNFYKFILINWNSKTGKTSIGVNDLGKINSRSKNSDLIVIGKEQNFPTVEFLNEKIKLNQTIAKDYLIKQSNESSAKEKRGFHYFKACDCYIPKTFSPSSPGAVFEIEGNDLNKKSSFHIYNRWGEEVYKAEPYSNNWNGRDKYGEKLKLGTYYFTFQGEEGLEVVNEFIKLIDEEKEKRLKDKTLFIHIPDTVHYVIFPTTKTDFEETKQSIKTSISMLGGNQRYSSIYLGSDTNQPLFIVRKFDNFEAAEKFIKNFTQLSNKKLKLYAVNQPNYRNILRQKSIVKYEEFYKGL